MRLLTCLGIIGLAIITTSGSALPGQRLAPSNKFAAFADKKRPVRMSMNAFMMDADKVASLRRAVKKMKSLPPEHPFSWVFQANIHARPTWPEFVSNAGLAADASIDVRLLAENRQFNPDHDVFGGCPHRNWWFFPWHRAYLFYFERILRWAANDASLALPYWNYYELDQRQLPAMYTLPDLPDGTRNPLYIPDSVNIKDDKGKVRTVRMRNPLYNSQSGALATEAVTFGLFNDALQNRVFYIDRRLNDTTFGGVLSFGPKESRGEGLLENVPHDQIHGEIGGPTVFEEGWRNVGLMGFVPYAARDPIFWAHHTNIDRDWAMWEKLGGKNPANFKDPAERLWLSMLMKFYDVKDGLPAPVTISVGDFLQLDLGYDYDDLAPPKGVPTEPLLAARKVDESVQPVGVFARTMAHREIALGVKERVVVPMAAADKMDAQALDRLRSAKVSGTFVLELIDVQLGRKIPGSLYYDVYLDLPKGELPGKQSKLRVGRITFFGVPHESGGHGGMSGDGNRLRYDVTKIMSRIDLKKRDPNEVASVTFVPSYGGVGVRAEEQEEPALKIGHVRLLEER